MVNNLFKGVVHLPSDEAFSILKETGEYSDGNISVKYDPLSWIYITPTSNVITLNGNQTITGRKTFTESIYLANTDGTVDRIAHINNNFVIYSGATNGLALLNIDEGLGKISAFNKELAFKEDLADLEISGGVDLSGIIERIEVLENNPGGVSQTDFDNLKNNVTQIVDSNNTFRAGGADTRTMYNAVCIGYNSVVKGTMGIAIGDRTEATSMGAIAIGSGSYAYERQSIAIGDDANSHAYGTIQLGKGTNRTANTLQVFDDNIYNHDTHTLTVQNIELNGVDLHSIFSKVEVFDSEEAALAASIANPTKICLY